MDAYVDAYETLVGELDGIADKILEDLPVAKGITLYGFWNPSFRTSLEVHSGFEKCLEVANYGADNGGDIDDVCGKGEAAGYQFGIVENVVNNL